MATWRLAKSLVKLRTQVNKEWPKRNKASDGTIGDQAHSSRVSQHNPNSAGVVTAFDITHDPKNGADMNKLKEQLIKDSRTWYVIFNRKIWQSGRWSNYTGANPHDKHLHISTKQDAKNYDNSENWDINGNIEDMKTNRDDAILLYRIALGIHSPTEKQKKDWTNRELTPLLKGIYNGKRFKDRQKKFNSGDPTSNDPQVKQSLKDKITNFIKGA